MVQIGGQNQQWPISGRIGYISAGLCGVPIACKRGGEPSVAHKWVDWLQNTCCLGDSQRFKTGDKISSGPQVGGLPT